MADTNEKQLPAHLAKRCRSYYGSEPVEFLRQIKKELDTYSDANGLVVLTLTVLLKSYDDEHQRKESSFRVKVPDWRKAGGGDD